jgi:hypothetical protein
MVSDAGRARSRAAGVAPRKLRQSPKGSRTAPAGAANETDVSKFLSPDLQTPARFPGDRLRWLFFPAAFLGDPFFWRHVSGETSPMGPVAIFLKFPRTRLRPCQCGVDRVVGG